MVKKKVNNRQLIEAKKAQLNVGRESYAQFNVVSNGTAVISAEHKQHATQNFSLAIPAIKKALTKDLAFAVFTLLLLVYLRQNAVGFDMLTKLFNS